MLRQLCRLAEDEKHLGETRLLQYYIEAALDQKETLCIVGFIDFGQ